MIDKTKYGVGWGRGRERREKKDRERKREKSKSLFCKVHSCIYTIHMAVRTSPYSPSIQMRADFPSGSETSSKEVGSWGITDSIIVSNFRRISTAHVCTDYTQNVYNCVK